MVHFAGSKTFVLKFELLRRPTYYVRTLRNIPKLQLCSFYLVEKGRPFRNIWKSLHSINQQYSICISIVYYKPIDQIAAFNLAAIGYLPTYLLPSYPTVGHNSQGIKRHFGTILCSFYSLSRKTLDIGD